MTGAGSAVNLLRNGANIIAVQRLLGHESLSITQLYLNLAQSDIQNQHRILAGGASAAWKASLT